MPVTGRMEAVAARPALCQTVFTAQRTCRPDTSFQLAARRAISQRLAETVAAVPAAERGAVGQGRV